MRKDHPTDEANIGDWCGKSWKDDDDPNITWSNVPTNQPTLTFSGRMVPVQQIIAKSVQWPEFDYKGMVEIEHPRT